MNKISKKYYILASMIIFFSTVIIGYYKIRENSSVRVVTRKYFSEDSSFINFPPRNTTASISYRKYKNTTISSETPFEHLHTLFKKDSCRKMDQSGSPSESFLTRKNQSTLSRNVDQKRSALSSRKMMGFPCGNVKMSYLKILSTASTV